MLTAVEMPIHAEPSKIASDGGEDPNAATVVLACVTAPALVVRRRYAVAVLVAS